MIQQYIHYLRTLKGYSENTCQAYLNDLTAFIKWAKARNANARWSTITRDDVDAYIDHMAKNGLKPATTNRSLSAISGIYRYMKRQGHDVTNPAQYESRRKIGSKVPNTIPYKELEQAYEHSYGVVKVMIGLLTTTGMRIQEMLDINMEDIDFERSAIKIHGKGNKERIVYTLPTQLETLRIYKDNGHTQGRIFIQSQREARRMIWEALSRYSTAKQLSPHAIRHTFATHMAERGVNCSTLQAILGHKHMETTQQYINLGQSAAQQACQLYSLL